MNRSASTCAASVLLAALASADGQNPGSVLVFPEFDNRSGIITVLTVTNTAGGREDPIDVEFVYVGKTGVFGEPLQCLEFNRTQTLTPNDTFTAITNFHNPQQEQGFCYVFAKTHHSQQAISFNHLTGSQLVVDGIESISYAVSPWAFRSPIDRGLATDVDADGIRDLDGIEYEPAPAEILVPRFFAQSSPFGGGGFVGELILINLTGGAQFTATVDFLVYNDNEEVFSAAHSFYCWDKIALPLVSPVFESSFLDSTSHNPLESISGVEYGWFRIDGDVASSTATQIDDPAILAVFLERVFVYETGDLPFELGTQTNGDLLPTGVVGDL